VGKHEEKRLLRRPCDKWEGNIKMSYMEIVWVGMYWAYLAQITKNYGLF
jgi:hypothetical protein